MNRKIEMLDLWLIVPLLLSVAGSVYVTNLILTIDSLEMQIDSYQSKLEGADQGLAILEKTNQNLQETIEKSNNITIVKVVYNVTVNTSDGGGLVIPWNLYYGNQINKSELGQLTSASIAEIARHSVNSIENINKKTGDFFQFYHEYFNHFDYTVDIDHRYGGDYVQTPKEFVRNNLTGDCDDSAAFLATVAKAYGLRVRVMLGIGQGGGHAWIQIYHEEEWTDIDSTNEAIGEDELGLFFSTLYIVDYTEV